MLLGLDRRLLGLPAFDADPLGTTGLTHWNLNRQDAILEAGLNLVGINRLSAESRDLFDKSQMWFIGATEMSTNAFSQLLCRKQAIGFHNGLLRMDPFGLNRVEPGTLGGQKERQDANTFASLFDLLIVLPNPTPNHFAHMPGGIIPDQEPVPLALGSQTLTTMLQKLDADRTHRAAGHEAQPDLRAVGILRRALLPQDAIARQGLRVGIAFFPGLLDQANRSFLALPGMQAWSGKAAPPDFIEKADGPIWLRTGVSDQAIAGLFFRR